MSLSDRVEYIFTKYLVYWIAGLFNIMFCFLILFTRDLNTFNFILIVLNVLIGVFNIYGQEWRE